jgi:lysyl-tRNA synthetase class II
VSSRSARRPARRPRRRPPRLPRGCCRSRCRRRVDVQRRCRRRRGAARRRRLLRAPLQRRQEVARDQEPRPLPAQVPRHDRYPPVRARVGNREQDPVGETVEAKEPSPSLAVCTLSARRQQDQVLRHPRRRPEVQILAQAQNAKSLEDFIASNDIIRRGDIIGVTGKPSRTKAESSRSRLPRSTPLALSPPVAWS